LEGVERCTYFDNNNASNGEYMLDMDDRIWGDWIAR